MEKELEPNPLENKFIQEWQSFQLSQSHVAEALGKVFEAWQKDRVELELAKGRIKELEEKEKEKEQENG